AATAGIDHVYDGEFPFFVGGGVATFDCNDDGLPEVFLAGGTNAAALYLNRSEVGGALRFEQLDSPVTDLDAVTGGYPLDVDSDGTMDLVVLRRGTNAVLRGTGNCGFEDVTDRLGLAGTAKWTIGFSATWEADDVLPTLAFGNYLVPDTYDCDVNELYRQGPIDDEQGPIYGPPVELPSHCTLSMLLSDWNHDGGMALRVSNDRNYDRNAQEQLWQVQPGVAPREYTEADGWRPVTIWGMGIASHDVTGDGRPEVFLSSQADNKLQTLDAGATGPSYRDIALERGVTAQRPYTGGDVLPSTAWHPAFADLNNDGLIDLFVAKGNVDAQPDYASFDPNNLLLGQPDGTFVEAGTEAGIATAVRSRGAAVVDLNLDGLLDLVVVNRRTRAEVWRNVGTGTADSPTATGHWVGLRLRQSAPNVDAVGAWVEVRLGDRTITHEVTVGGGHASGSAGWLHVGLGTATSAEVRITFPGAAPGPWLSVQADSFWVVERGASAPQQWQPR
ncbi:MAG: FG-GAP repeat domain-containing protein, partial [Ilumatobacteraceae bacterium]